MRNLFGRTARNQRGDTIVEVMIVLAVLGTAVSISYATANKSLLATRAAQENTQATGILQSQVELLRSMAPASTHLDATKDIFPTTPSPATFCINTATKTVVTTTPCSEGIYKYTITYYSGSTAPAGETLGDFKNTFVLKATWDNVSGEGTDSSTVSYRLHPL